MLPGKVPAVAVQKLQLGCFFLCRELKDMGQRCGMCAMLCHISRQKLGGQRKYVLRIASVGEAKALLSRTTGSLTLAHTPPQVYYISL